MNKEKESILTSIKKMLGIQEDYTNFDTDIIININTVFGILNQLGIGPKEGFKIEDSGQTWEDYISEGDDLEAIKTYIYLKVKIVFDPALSGTVMEANKEIIRELEWRLNMHHEYDEEVI